MDQSSKVGRLISSRIFIISAFLVIILIIVVNLFFFSQSKLQQKNQPSNIPTNPTTGVLPKNSAVINKDINTNNWESYLNTALKISFQYPAGYQPNILSQDPVNLVIVSSPDLLKSGAKLTPNDLKILIFSGPAPPEDTLEKYIEDQKLPVGSDDKVILEEFLTINGTRFYHEIIQDPREGADGEDTYLTIINNKRIHIKKKPFNTKNQKEFNEILSTITFNK
jgi:hypothetical protein